MKKGSHTPISWGKPLGSSIAWLDITIQSFRLSQKTAELSSNLYSWNFGMMMIHMVVTASWFIISCWDLRWKLGLIQTRLTKTPRIYSSQWIKKVIPICVQLGAIWLTQRNLALKFAIHNSNQWVPKHMTPRFDWEMATLFHGKTPSLFEPTRHGSSNSYPSISLSTQIAQTMNLVSLKEDIWMMTVYRWKLMAIEIFTNSVTRTK